MDKMWQSLSQCDNPMSQPLKNRENTVPKFGTEFSQNYFFPDRILLPPPLVYQMKDKGNLFKPIKQLNSNPTNQAIPKTTQLPCETWQPKTCRLTGHHNRKSKWHHSFPAGAWSPRHSPVPSSWTAIPRLGYRGPLSARPPFPLLCQRRESVQCLTGIPKAQRKYLDAVG